jgi:hypothetical protein
VGELLIKEFRDGPSGGGQHGKTTVLDFCFAVVPQVFFGLGETEGVETNLEEKRRNRRRTCESSWPHWSSSGIAAGRQTVSTYISGQRSVEGLGDLHPWQTLAHDGRDGLDGLKIGGFDDGFLEFSNDGTRRSIRGGARHKGTGTADGREEGNGGKLHGSVVVWQEDYSLVEFMMRFHDVLKGALLSSSTLVDGCRHPEVSDISYASYSSCSSSLTLLLRDLAEDLAVAAYS